MSKRILSVFLVCLMLLSAFVFTGVGSAASQNPDVVMPMADPVIDGIIEDSGAWSEAADFNEDTVSNFWSGNALNSSAKLYFAYSTKGLYFAADIEDNDLILSTGYDNIDGDYGFNGDVMTLMLDALGLFETSETQVTPWYNFGIFEDGSVKCFRSRANESDITDTVTLAGGLTDKGFCFESFISWNDVTADAKAAGGFDVSGLELISKGSTSRGAAMFMDRYQKNSTTVDTWGRYITVCDTTYDGWAGSDTSGYTAKSFGLVLKNGNKPEHIWTSTTVTKEATCAEEGSMIRTCGECGMTEEVSIPTIDHNYGDWVDVSASLRERECTVCGDTEQESYTPDKKSDQLIVTYLNASVPLNAYEFHNIDVVNFHPAHIEQSAPGSGSVFSHPYTSRLDQYRTIAREQNPDIKFLFTVANGNLSIFESWFFNESMAERLADEVINVVKTYDYDGFDVDYEFPTGAANTKANFVHFMKTLKEKFAELGKETGKEYVLSMAVPGTQWTFDLFDMNALAEHVSYFNMMNYDLYIGENGKYTTHHHTPAYDNYNGLSGGSVYGDIQLYLERGIPADKIVAGCGLYSLRWTGVEAGDTNGLYQGGTLDYTNLHYSQIKYSFVNKGGYVRYWDEKAGAPYLYNATQKVFISYDDEQSVELKCKITAEEGIRGIMVFDYVTCDGLGLFDSMRGWLDKYVPEDDILDQFEDVNKNAWYADAVRYCVTNGYASGMSETVFAPNATLTRAQFVQLIAGIDGVDLSDYNETDSTFADVKVGAWFHNAITWAVRNEYVAGMTPEEFKPNENLTREQLVRILYNYAQDNGVDVTGRADLTVFEDNNKISDWAYEELSWAVDAGIISGMTPTTVGPRGTATRAQAMQIIKQFDALEKNVTNNTQPTPEPVTPNNEYNEGVVLVKAKDSFNSEDLGTLAYTSAQPLYNGADWYAVELCDGESTEEAVNYLIGTGNFENVDYDYIMGVDANESDNPEYDSQTNLGVHNIPYGWTHNGKHPGGSPDVVVAVIDTGVDYNHLDLRNNIWTNTAEIPDNGKDDDGNGYIDDVYGWDCVGNDKDPMDDNGHGTHVAGIIAAENNKEGGIGIAYGCKVMVLKAGNSSGYFNNSDIAEAVQYAYMNGASVINMSFGGSNISVAVEDALENAYNSCVLVAAAGNDSACNDLSCRICGIKKVSYPAALPYVIGVMSTDKGGKNVSSFSNYDHSPYDTVEYEVYAVGEGVGSTWPANKYACLNGTSMAAPTVSGIAALMRSYYADREMYSTKFIQSQIVNTGTVNPYNYLTEETDSAHSVSDVYEAMTRLPKPEVNLYDYYVDDSTDISSVNNGNGVVDAGETVRLYISLHNRGGVASNVNVTIDTDRGMGLTDPYFTLVNTSIQLSDIGTYSVRESGDKYFEIIVDSDCPNDYLVDFNIRYTYKNGMDEKDNTAYSGDGKATFNVSSGWYLPSLITEDTVFTDDRLYIVGEDVVIPEGVTVTFEEGCRIQFYDGRKYYDSPRIVSYGTLNFLGTKDSMITIYPSLQGFACGISGVDKFEYVKAINLSVSCNEINSSVFLTESNNDATVEIYKSGDVAHAGFNTKFTGISTSRLIASYVEAYYYVKADVIDGCFIYLNTSITNNIIGYSDNNVYFINNIFYTEALSNISSSGNGISGTSGYKTYYVCNNRFVSASDSDTFDLTDISFKNEHVTLENNYFSELYRKNAQSVFDGYIDSEGHITVDVYGNCSDISVLYPYVVSVEMFDKDGNSTTTVGKEEITVRVTFNRPMDMTKDTFLTFGTIEPYADYKIEGSYIDEYTWEGQYILKAQIENGQNFLKVNNACAEEDQTKTVFGEYQLYEFTIDTTEAMAMNLQAMAKDEGILLTFAQDDYDTLLGYNIYRSTEKDGNYVKLNPTVLLADESSYLDDNAEPGKTYWYTYTVVLSDFTESKPAGKVMATAKDTMAPTVYHTPVNQGYENNNLVISCTASDNVAVSSVTLYYRTVGADSYKSLNMSKVNDKYSATIFGSDVTLAGIEYYIVAYDGVSYVEKGSADAPYTVTVKSADSLLGMGDVDGNGSITTKDALMLMQCLNGDLILSDDAFKRADLNGDGVLSSAEALRILQYVNGKVTDLDM